MTANGVTYANDVNGSNSSLYAEGYKDNAFEFDTTASEWTTNADGTISRTVTKICKYCGHRENVTEYRVTYYYSITSSSNNLLVTSSLSNEKVSISCVSCFRPTYKLSQLAVVVSLL